MSLNGIVTIALELFLLFLHRLFSLFMSQYSSCVIMLSLFLLVMSMCRCKLKITCSFLSGGVYTDQTLIVPLIVYTDFLQMGIQSLLVVIAMSCVPCMLVVKTMVLRRQHLWKKHLVCFHAPMSFQSLCWYLTQSCSKEQANINK